MILLRLSGRRAFARKRNVEKVIETGTGGNKLYNTTAEIEKKDELK